MKWQVDLHGDKDDLEDLSKIFTSLDLQIIREGEGYFLKSSSFEGCTDSEAVKVKADKLLMGINAIKKLALDSSDHIRRGAIRYKDQQGNRQISLDISYTVKPKVQVQLTVIRADGSIDEIHPGYIMKDWIHLMESEERVERVFNLITHDFKTLGGFYKIIEVIQEDDFPPVSRKGEFYDAIDILKETAQSYTAIGPDARHAREKFKKPKKMIEIEEAKHLTRRIIEMWLNSKISR